MPDVDYANVLYNNSMKKNTSLHKIIIFTKKFAWNLNQNIF